MTFTTTPPTTTGFYAWRLFSNDIPNPYWVTSDGETFWRDGKYPATNGEWCRLVPAEEVERAWDECCDFCDQAIGRAESWRSSRAKLIAEGKE